MHPSCGRRSGRTRRVCQAGAQLRMNLIVWSLGRHCGGRYLVDFARFFQSMIVVWSRVGFRGTLVAAVNALLRQEKARRRRSIDEASVSSNHCDLSV